MMCQSDRPEKRRLKPVLSFLLALTLAAALPLGVYAGQLGETEGNFFAAGAGRTPVPETPYHTEEVGLPVPGFENHQKQEGDGYVIYYIEPVYISLERVAELLGEEGNKRSELTAELLALIDIHVFDSKGNRHDYKLLNIRNPVEAEAGTYYLEFEMSVTVGAGAKDHYGNMKILVTGPESPEPSESPEPGESIKPIESIEPSTPVVIGPVSFPPVISPSPSPAEPSGPVSPSPPPPGPSESAEPGLPGSEGPSASAAVDVPASPPAGTPPADPPRTPEPSRPVGQGDGNGSGGRDTDSGSPPPAAGGEAGEDPVLEEKPAVSIPITPGIVTGGDGPRGPVMTTFAAMTFGASGFAALGAAAALIPDFKVLNWYNKIRRRRMWR